MKLIQSLEGMSVNSLKPSINSEPESSLDSCIMKEVDDCILPKDMHSQNNGEKELRLAGYEIGNVGSPPKKMFEQVDLNSSLPGSEVPLKKDSWNSGSLFDKTSEKENLVDPSEVRFDILSDDDNDSIHLKISSDDETSIEDREINTRSPSGKPLLNSNDEVSQNDPDCGQNEDDDDDCEKEDSRQISNGVPQLSENVMVSTEKATFSMEQEGDTDAKSTQSFETEYEDTSEELESKRLRSDSPHLSVSNNSCDHLETTVNEVKSVPSPKLKEHLRSSDFNNEISDEGSLKNSDKNMVESCTQEVSQHNSDLQNSADEDNSEHVESEMPERCVSFSDEINISQEEKSEEPLIDNNPNSEDKMPSSSEKEGILSDDAVNSDKKQSQDLNEEVNKSKKAIFNNYVEKETNCSEKIEGIDCDLSVDSPNSSEIVIDSVNEEKLLAEDDMSVTEEKLLEEEEDTSVNEEKLLEDGTLADSQENESNVKNGNAEENFLEILEYQPINEEIEESKEIQPDKEIDQNFTLEDENAAELSLMSGQVSDKEIVKRNLSTSDVNNSKDAEHNPDIEMDTYTDSPKSESKDNSEYEESVSVTNESEPSISREMHRLDSSEIEDISEEINSVSDAEEDKDLEITSKNANTTKTEKQPENSEVKSNRKRTSNCEETLVNSSKRSKVAVGESEAKDECDVFVYKEATNCEPKRSSEGDIKEESDRVKRLSNSVSDGSDVKKIRVMPETSKVERLRDVRKSNSTDKNFELVRNSESEIDSKESSKSEVKLNSLPFLRNFSRSQLKNLTRNDLEELVLQKICEAITERSNCGELRELAQSLEQKIKGWQKKSLQLTKQVKDLNLVLRRYSTDLQKGFNAVPVKITRSVGLQVQMPNCSSNTWRQDETSRSKSDKSSSSVAAPSTPSAGNTPVKSNTVSPVSKPASVSAPKLPETSESQGASIASRPTSQSIPQSSSNLKAFASKSPTTSNSISPNPSKSNNKQLSSTVNNKSNSSPDLQVIDLTDHEEKTKNTSNRLAPVSNVPTSTSVSVPVSTTVVSPAVSSSNTVANVSGGCRSIRVVQHLSGSTPVLTQSVSNSVAAQRVTYFVPTTSVPVQSRQIIISTASQIRPSGVLSMSQRQNPLPTILLKPSQVVPVSPTAATGTSIIRTTTMNNSIQLTRPPPRTGQLLQRFATPSIQSSALSVVQSSGLSVSSVSHPAPLPAIPPSGPGNANWKKPPPKPDLKISKVPNRNQQGIVLSWNMTVTSDYEEIASYQLFAYQEGSAPPSTHLWKKVGDVKALPLPMACTLTQFMEGHKYHFAVRAVDIYARYGPFSSPGNIVLTRH